MRTDTLPSKYVDVAAEVAVTAAAAELAEQDGFLTLCFGTMRRCSSLRIRLTSHKHFRCYPCCRG